MEQAKQAAERDQVYLQDVQGRKIVSIEARWMATLREERFRTWDFLVLMAKKVLQGSSHDARIKDSNGEQVDLNTVPSPGTYTWVLRGETGSSSQCE
jgi:hypothetical protein